MMSCVLMFEQGFNYISISKLKAACFLPWVFLESTAEFSELSSGVKVVCDTASGGLLQAHQYYDIILNIMTILYCGQKKLKVCYI